MKLIEENERVHVLNQATVDTWSIAREIAAASTAADQEEAFYVCDIGDIVKKYQLWKEHMPRVKPFYAVKCNDSPIVLDVLAALGTGFDCASKMEINKVLPMGIRPEDIVFANPSKPASHIRHAASTGVAKMTFDNEYELHKIKKFYPNARLIIRIRCDSEVAQCQLGMKFGCDAIHEAPRLIACARELGLELIGVSFHVGSGCGDPPVFRRAISAARTLFDYAKTLGYRFDLLDIGGGYPGNSGTSINAIAEVVNCALGDFFPDPDITVIAEPGRYFVASAYTLTCNVHSKREIFNPKDGSLKHTMYYLNDGVYGSFNCLLYDHQHVTAIPFKENYSDKLLSSSLWGPTCDGLDQIADDILLPDLNIGDWVGFGDMGAYTLPVASPFNGFPIPKVYIIASQETWKMLKDLLPMTEDHFKHGTVIHSMNSYGAKTTIVTQAKSLDTITRDIALNIQVQV
uniref:ornithine decarboxylase n=1 Tax=Xenopsylla cheopis TaxID=163159 RepID=A0A6M2DSV2_XENCH